MLKSRDPYAAVSLVVELMLKSRDPYAAISLVVDLNLFPTVFPLPHAPSHTADVPPDDELPGLCEASFAATCTRLHQWEQQLPQALIDHSSDLRVGLLLAALLMPLRHAHYLDRKKKEVREGWHAHYLDRKKKEVPFAQHIVLDSLKLKRAYADMAGAPTLYADVACAATLYADVACPPTCMLTFALLLAARPSLVFPLPLPPLSLSAPLPPCPPQVVLLHAAGEDFTALAPLLATAAAEGAQRDHDIMLILSLSAPLPPCAPQVVLLHAAGEDFTALAPLLATAATEGAQRDHDIMLTLSLSAPLPPCPPQVVLLHAAAEDFTALAPLLTAAGEGGARGGGNAAAAEGDAAVAARGEAAATAAAATAAAATAAAAAAAAAARTGGAATARGLTLISPPHDEFQDNARVLTGAVGGVLAGAARLVGHLQVRWVLAGAVRLVGHWQVQYGWWGAGRKAPLQDEGLLAVRNLFLRWPSALQIPSQAGSKSPLLKSTFLPNPIFPPHPSSPGKLLRKSVLPLYSPPLSSARQAPPQGKLLRKVKACWPSAVLLASTLPPVSSAAHSEQCGREGERVKGAKGGREVGEEEEEGCKRRRMEGREECGEEDAGKESEKCDQNEFYLQVLQAVHAMALLAISPSSCFVFSTPFQQNSHLSGALSLLDLLYFQFDPKRLQPCWPSSRSR
ncbi:unnamed protein product [Closterium sp. Naga37s-1]|nr:unnamed protein product [Closterium sp. Naga37s-1]